MSSFFVPLQPPSQNDFHVSPSGRGRWHYQTLKRVWCAWIPPVTKPKRARGKVSLTVVRLIPRGRGFHPYDESNLHGGLKPIIDLLVQAGYLVDDRPDMLDLTLVQKVADVGEQPGTWFEFQADALPTGRVV